MHYLQISILIFGGKKSIFHKLCKLFSHWVENHIGMIYLQIFLVKFVEIRRFLFKNYFRWAIGAFSNARQINFRHFVSKREKKTESNTQCLLANGIENSDEIKNKTSEKKRFFKQINLNLISTYPCWCFIRVSQIKWFFFYNSEIKVLNRGFFQN